MDWADLQVIPDDVPDCATLRAMREALGLSQSELAAAIGIGLKGDNGERIIRRWEHDPDCVPNGAAWRSFKYLSAAVALYQQLGPHDPARVITSRLLPASLR